MDFGCSWFRLEVHFGVLFACATGDPAAQNWFFYRLGQRLSDSLVPGGVWECFWVVFGPLFGYLEMSFVDDFEKILVFVRCVNSILTQTSCCLVTDMDGGIEPSNTPSCASSMSCQYVCLTLWLLCFHLCLCLFFVCRAPALACVIVCDCMRACLCALSDWGLCRDEKYHSGCRARAT